MKFIIPLILFLVGTFSILQPVSSFDSVYLEPLEGVLSAVFAEAKGEFNWSKDSRLKISRKNRVNYHQTAGRIMWLWFNLNTTMPVNSLLINVIDEIKAENYKVDLSKDMLPTTLASIFYKIKAKFEMDDAIISESMTTMGQLMDSKIPPIHNNYYLTTNLMHIWPYYEENPSLDHQLHSKFLYVAYEQFNHTCFSVLSTVQAQARTILRLGIQFQFSEKITRVYYRESSLFPYFTREKVRAKSSTDPPCSQLPERTIEFDLYLLMYNVRRTLLSDPKFYENWEGEYAIVNYDYGYGERYFY